MSKHFNAICTVVQLRGVHTEKQNRWRGIWIGSSCAWSWLMIPRSCMRSAVGISSGGGRFDTAVVRVEVKSKIVLDMIAIAMAMLEKQGWRCRGVVKHIVRGKFRSSLYLVLPHSAQVGCVYILCYLYYRYSMSCQKQSQACVEYLALLNYISLPIRKPMYTQVIF